MKPCRCVAALGPLLAVFAATATSAADLPAPARSYYPPVAIPANYDWTGFYIGGQVGAGLLADTITQASATGLTVLSGNTVLSPVGLIGGAQAGVNYQFGGFVVGAEGTWNWTNLTGSGTVPTTAGTLERATSAPHWFASAAGRFGYAGNAWLPYVKAGGAWMNVDYTQDIITGGVVSSSQLVNANRAGFVAGAGIEYGLTEHFSAKLEYDFYGFGSSTYKGFAQTPVTIRSDLHTLIFALDYRFTWPGGGTVFAK